MCRSESSDDEQMPNGDEVHEIEEQPAQMVPEDNSPKQSNSQPQPQPQPQELPGPPPGTPPAQFVDVPGPPQDPPPAVPDVPPPAVDPQDPLEDEVT